MCQVEVMKGWNLHTLSYVYESYTSTQSCLPESYPKHLWAIQIDIFENVLFSYLPLHRKYYGNFFLWGSWKRRKRKWADDSQHHRVQGMFHEVYYHLDEHHEWIKMHLKNGARKQQYLECSTGLLPLKLNDMKSAK